MVYRGVHQLKRVLSPRLLTEQQLALKSGSIAPVPPRRSSSASSLTLQRTGWCQCPQDPAEMEETKE